MKKTTIFFILISLLFMGCEELKQQLKRLENENPKQTDFKTIMIDYPPTFKDTTISDNYHGKIVADPYRWLEDENSQETKKWIEAQNAVTFEFLSQIPYRKAIKQRLEDLWNYERYSVPQKKGGKYYFFKNDGLQNQSVLYVQDSLDGVPRVVLDPNKFSADGIIAMGYYAFSKQGEYLAFQISEGGSDWQTAHILDLRTGQQLPDKVEWIKFSGLAWHGEGFYYSRYPTPADREALSGSNEFHQVYYHRVGTPQAEDELVFADRRNPATGFSAMTTEDERYLLISAWRSTSGNALYLRDLTKSDADFITIVDNYEFDYIPIENIEDKVLVLTNDKAANQRLVQIPVPQPSPRFWEDLLPEGNDKLESVKLLGDKLVAVYLHNAFSRLDVFNLNGHLEASISLPGMGTVEAISGEINSSEAFYSFNSFVRPSTIYQLDLENKQSKVFKVPDSSFDPEGYQTEQVWYESYDKTKVPMFLTYKKGLKRDGLNPTLLYGYGGFNVPVLPAFNVSKAVLLENGGIFAVANIRGGGEFGREWHLAGTKHRKQNVFNDFQAAAEYLIDQKFTSSEKLAIEGGSNGGLLVAVCMIQRPDLYKVVLPRVGVLDMLRYHKFTIGRAWATDYGLSDDPKEFDYLISYSPLHNVEPASYPATLITTADHDDRVVPAHSFKFIAALQANQRGKNPVLIRIETKAGHGAGKPTSKLIEESADILSFTLYNMAVDFHYDRKELQ